MDNRQKPEWIERSCRGGRAKYLAGLEVEHFDVNPDVRIIAGQVTSKVDANTLFIPFWPYSFKYLQSSLEKLVGGKIRFWSEGHKAVPWTGRQTFIAGFCQPEHAHKAKRWLEQNFRLSSQTRYTVYLTVRRDISDAVRGRLNASARKTGLFIQDPSTRSVEALKENPIKLQISGKSREIIAKLKKSLEDILVGSSISIRGTLEFSHGVLCYNRGLWDKWFMTPPGKAWNKEAEKEGKCTFSVNPHEPRTRMYGSPPNRPCRRAFERKFIAIDDELESKKEKEDSKRHVIRLNTAQFRKVETEDAVAKAKAVDGIE